MAFLLISILILDSRGVTYASSLLVPSSRGGGRIWTRCWPPHHSIEGNHVRDPSAQTVPSSVRRSLCPYVGFLSGLTVQCLSGCGTSSNRNVI